MAGTRTERSGIGLRSPGLLLGIGLGGFLDGILLHQLLQWHHLLTSTGDHPSTTVPGLEANTVADGLFHAATPAATAAGLVLLWRAVQHGAGAAAGRKLLGWILAGWGVFNLAEGLVNHHLLELHHVREGVANQGLYDAGFLALGAALVAVGLLLTRQQTPVGGEAVVDVRERTLVTDGAAVRTDA